jgi:hypothetical protein
MNLHMPAHFHKHECIPDMDLDMDMDTDSAVIIIMDMKINRISASKYYDLINFFLTSVQAAFQPKQNCLLI